MELIIVISTKLSNLSLLLEIICDCIIPFILLCVFILNILCKKKYNIKNWDDLHLDHVTPNDVQTALTELNLRIGTHSFAERNCKNRMLIRFLYIVGARETSFTWIKDELQLNHQIHDFIIMEKENICCYH